jgi:NAD(P)-dependent dehydrogenase (short-subunit alcohol dehydrogenase family)
MIRPTRVRQRILITGASSGLGAGMARAFAAKGRDLALCARRLDRLEDLKAELRVPEVFAALAAEIGEDGRRHREGQGPRDRPGLAVGAAGGDSQGAPPGITKPFA